MSLRPRPPSNPFATRWVRPGALDYEFASGESAALLVARLAAAGGRGQIVGPHGAGKSTLLNALRPALLAAGKRLLDFQLHDGQRRLPGGTAPLEQPADLEREALLVVVDGYEQLGRWERFRLRRIGRHGCGLLVTAHEDVGLPTVADVRASLDLTRRLVRELLAEYPPEIIVAKEVAAAYARCQGNVRETLFALYDLFESRRVAQAASQGA